LTRIKLDKGKAAFFIRLGLFFSSQIFAPRFIRRYPR
jgi:hypothetical protein